MIRRPRRSTLFPSTTLSRSRGDESEEDARFCRDVLGAEVVDGRGGETEDELRQIRYSFATDRLRATGHTATDRKSTRLNSSHSQISYAVFCLKKKKRTDTLQ